MHLRAEERKEREMKKQWVKRLAAVSLTVVVGTGLGTTLWAQGEEKDVNLGGGVRSSKNNL